MSGITKDDVRKALATLEGPLAKGSSDLNSANGAADGSDSSGKDLSAPGDDMNATHGNKKKKGNGTMKSQGETPEDFNKSLPPAVETKVEVSDFLKSLVDHNAGCMDKLRDAVVKSDLANEDRMDEISECIDGLQKSMGQVGVVLKAICERIGIVENQPANVAKSQTATDAQAQQAAPVAKSVTADRQFADPQGGSEANQSEGDGMYKSLVGKPPQIQKAAIASAICDLVKKGEAQDVDVINFETYSFITPELNTRLRAVL